MKILLCGANGQVGTELQQVGTEAGFNMISMSEQQLDITNESSVVQCIEKNAPNIVINAAAYTAVDKAESDQKLCYAVNRDASQYLAHACLQSTIPLFHLSTDYVFGGDNPNPYTEKDTPDPINTYGVSKWQGEQRVTEILDQHIILRVAWVFGAHGNNFVKTMARLMKARDQLSIVNDQVGSPTPAKDIAITLIKLAKQYKENKSLTWGTYHYGGQPYVSWFEFAQAIKQQINANTELEGIATEQYPTPAKRAANTRLDSQLLEDTFGICPPDWRKRLAETLA